NHRALRFFSLREFKWTDVPHKETTSLASGGHRFNSTIQGETKMKHVKKAGLVAVVAAFGLPWAAQAETSVTMYGKLYPQIVYGKVSGASDAGTSSLSNQARLDNASYSGTGMASSNSKFGLTGSEDLGGNLKAIFQLEMNVDVHDGSGGSSSSMWNRNTFVGLQGDLGTIKFGQMDTPYKELGDSLSFLGVS